MPNISNIGRNKLLELEDYFNEFNISFYVDNHICKLYINYFYDSLLEAMNIIESIVNKLNHTNSLFFSIFKNKSISSDIKKYQAICDNLSSFSIEKNIKSCLKRQLEDKRYHICTPGSYKQIYQSTKNIIKKVGMNDLSNELEIELYSLVEKQEMASLSFNKIISNVAIYDLLNSKQQNSEDIVSNKNL